MEKTISKASPITIGIAVSVIGAVVAIMMYVNSIQTELAMVRSAMENHLNDPTIHHAGFRDMREDVDLIRELLVEIREVKVRLVRIEDKIEK